MVQAPQVILEAAAENVVEGHQIQDGVKESAVFPGIKQGIATADVELQEFFDVALLICDGDDGSCQQMMRQDKIRHGRTMQRKAR